MPRVPLRNACVRPPEGDSGPSCLKEQLLASLCFSMLGPIGDTTLPLADGRVEPVRRGTSGMDAARGVKGQGWPLYADPRSAGGRREVRERSSRTRMKERAFFCLLFFARAKKSEAPCKAQPVARAEESATPETGMHATRGGKRCAVFHPTTSPVAGNRDASCSAHLAAAEPSQPLTSTTTPSTPADSPPAAAAPPHSPAPCSDRSRSAAARTAPARRASRPAAGRRPCRSPLR